MNQFKTVVLLFALTASVFVYSQTDKNAIYKRTIHVADSIYAIGDLEGAKGAYFYASKLQPSDSYPTQQIVKIEKQIREQINKKIEFEKIVNQGNRLLEEGKKSEAVVKYEEALTIIDDFDVAANLKKIKKAIADEKAIVEKYEGKMAAGNKEFLDANYYEATMLFREAINVKKDEAAPLEALKNMRLRIVEEYGIHDSLVANGDKLYEQKEFKKALFMYKTALVLEPENKKTVTKYSELNNIVDYYAGLKSEFDKAVQDGDRAMTMRNFRVAETSFAKAVDIFPDVKYANEQLEIAKKLAMDSENLDKYFRESMSNGDALLASGNLEKALEQYNAAENLKPNQAKAKIAATEKRLKTVNALAEQYSKYVAGADTLFTARNFEEAYSVYKSAISLKDKEIEARVGSGKKIDETLCVIDTKYLESRLKETEKIIALVDKNFNDKKQLGDKEFAVRNLDNAIVAYKEALTIKPQDSYTLKQVETIVAMQEADAEKMKRDLANYDEAIKQGDEFFGNGNFRAAFNSYTKALEIKPKEQYPAAKLKAVKKELDIIDKQDAEYALYVKEGDYLFNAGKYTEAIAKYTQSQILKPNDEYAKSQIALANQNIAEIARKEEEARLAAIKKREELYAQSMTTGDSYLQLDEYEQAKLSFETALSVKPNDEVATKKLAEAEQLIKTNPKAMRERYAALIAEGDNLFANGKSLNSLDKYKEAYSIGVNNSGVVSKIDNVILGLQDSLILSLNNKAFNIIKGASIRLDLKPIAANVRKNTAIIIKAENVSGEKDVKIVLNYGSGYSLNGGVVVTLFTEQGSHYYLINLSQEPSWTGKENNWITLLGENGNIKVEEIRIYKLP